MKADLDGILDAAQMFTDQVSPHPMPVIDNNSIIMGFANVYGGYVHPVNVASKKYNIDPRVLIRRLGERKIVAGQEDAIEQEASAISSEMISKAS